MFHKGFRGLKICFKPKNLNNYADGSCNDSYAKIFVVYRDQPY